MTHNVQLQKHFSEKVDGVVSKSSKSRFYNPTGSEAVMPFH